MYEAWSTGSCTVLVLCHSLISDKLLRAHTGAALLLPQVGIEECLHIEFEYDKARYHLKDVVAGKIYFLLVRIKLKHMEVEIRRRETTGAAAQLTLLRHVGRPGGGGRPALVSAGKAVLHVVLVWVEREHAVGAGCSAPYK